MQNIPDHTLRVAADLINSHLEETLTPLELLQALQKAHEGPADEVGPCVTPAEAAKILKVSRRQIFRLIKAGRLRAFKLGSRSTRIPVSSLRRLAE